MRISDWSSDVCSSDLNPHLHETGGEIRIGRIADDEVFKLLLAEPDPLDVVARLNAPSRQLALDIVGRDLPPLRPDNDDEQQDGKQEADQHQLPSRPEPPRSGDKTSEHESLMRQSAGRLCKEKQKHTQIQK